jgi:hydrophobe/amphiphile efflux-1 (HAE1) family protein
VSSKQPHDNAHDGLHHKPDSEISNKLANAVTPESEYLFVRRPVLAAVISMVITLLGLFAMQSLPVSRYPQITPPAVQVTAFYPGASAADVATAVAAPIEQQLSSLNGLLYYKSSNTSDGTMSMSIYFDISRNQDLAAVDVQNAVGVATPQLPAAVRQTGVTITKANSDILALVAITSDDPRYDASYLSNYAKIYVENELKRIPGVGDSRVFGNLDFAMLISMNPERMAQLGITVEDVQQAVSAQNATKPGGRLGREPSPMGTQLTIPVVTTGRLTQPSEFGEIIVRARPDGSLVRVKDIAEVTMGSRGYDAKARVNGKPTANLLVFGRPGANNLEVKNAIVQRMQELAPTFPPGVRYEIPFDTTPFITESIKEVVKTLFEAMFLVTLVVFLFLKSWRATLIPVLAVPVSIIGTFLGLQALGFTINTLTLFGLVLAIGIVVDDAIVVIENVERIMEQDHVSPRVATNRAMKQVGGALVAIVLVLCAVFIPVAFVGGITGAMYKQFAATIVISVVISGLVALTLTPALCATLLRHKTYEEEGKFFQAFDRGFERLTRKYVSGATGVIDRPRTWMAGFAVILVLIGVLYKAVPGGFLPNEDKGYFAVSIQLPDAASLQRTSEVVTEVNRIVREEPMVRGTVALEGFALLTGSNLTNVATMFVTLKPWDERTGRDESLEAVLARINKKLGGLKEAVVFGFNLPEIPGLGITSGLELNLQQRSGDDVQGFAREVQGFVNDAKKIPSLQNVATNFRAEVPQLFVTVDEAAAQARGVNTSQVFATLQTMLSNLYINDFNIYGRPYRVQAEAQAQFRQTPEDIGRFFVRSNTGAMVPLSAVTESDMRGAPSLLTRFNGFPAALVTAAATLGASSGEGLDAVEKLVADKYAAQGIGYAYSGQSFQERESAGSNNLVLVLGLVLVFLVLAAQYESWSIPFAVLLGIPFGIVGALFGVWLRGSPSDVYLQVGLFTVVGLAAKNAILIVEFATSLRAQGYSIRDAAIEAARERFRPILMTSFAFILGVLPLVVAGGAGAGSRRSLGTGVFAGMLVATLVGVFFIPLFFALIRRFTERGADDTTRVTPRAHSEVAS